MQKLRKLPRDMNAHVVQVIALSTSQESSEPTETPKAPAENKNPAAVALGRLGGLKGGKARAAKLSPKQREDIAKKAALSRWRGPNKH